MNCLEFEEFWNELLDARRDPDDRVESSLEAHASTCERCRAVSARYQLLRQAIPALRPPVASAASLERLYALTVPSSPPTISIATSRFKAILRKPLAAAAAVALAWLGGSLWISTGPDERPEPALMTSIGPPQRPLGLALADETEAILDLARDASAPASRIGREMLDLGKLSTSGLEMPTEPFNEPKATDEADADPPGLLKAVGDRVGAGVKPLSGSARHAFSFLLGPPDEPDPTTSPQGRNSL